MVLMLSFEVAFGRWVFRASWGRIAADFGLRRGNPLAFGMLALLLAPVIVAKLKAVLAGRGL